MAESERQFRIVVDQEENRECFRLRTNTDVGGIIVHGTHEMIRTKIKKKKRKKKREEKKTVVAQRFFGVWAAIKALENS